jgi:phage protein D
MSLLVTCLARIGALEFAKVSDFEAESTWKNLGDSATLKLYGFVKVLAPDGTLSSTDTKVEDLVKVGDAVEVLLGYDGELRTEFKGYVAEIKLKVPFEVRLEDEFFHLKRTPVNRAWKNTTLRKLLTELVPTVQLSSTVPQIHIDSFRADRTTVAGVINKLKENYLVCAYFRDGRLFVGLPYTEFSSTSGIDGACPYYHFQQNVVDDDLTYKRQEDVRIKAKVVAMHRNGKNTTVPGVGDVDGEERTITLRTETTDKAELTRMAKAELAKFKYDGYRGSLTGFGVPFALHSGTADLHDGLHPQRDGRYLIDSVKTSLGPSSGFRRVVELGKRANS